jgi:hypothetical protein
MPGVDAEREWHAYLLDWNAPAAGEQGRPLKNRTDFDQSVISTSC